MELRHLTTFLVVARHLNFTRAAEELGYVQSSVTAQIKSLESDLDAKLFERLGRRVTLTDAGRELREHAGMLTHYAEQAREAVRMASGDVTKVRGTLRISAPESLCAYRLPPVLQGLRNRFPLVHVVFGPAGRAELLTSLAEGTLDVGFLLEESIRTPMTVAERIAEEPLRLVAHPEHRLTGRDRVRTADLAEDTLLVLEQGCAHRDVMEREVSRAGIHPAMMEFVSLEALKRCAAAGLGVAMLPAAAIAEETGRGQVAVLRWQVKPVLGVYLVRHKDRTPTVVMTELAALARDAWHQQPTAAAS